jgi:hypothetical protein
VFRWVRNKSLKQYDGIANLTAAFNSGPLPLPASIRRCNSSRSWPRCVASCASDSPASSHSSAEARAGSDRGVGTVIVYSNRSRVRGEDPLCGIGFIWVVRCPHPSVEGVRRTIVRGSKRFWFWWLGGHFHHFTNPSGVSSSLGLGTVRRPLPFTALASRCRWDAFWIGESSRDRVCAMGSAEWGALLALPVSRTCRAGGAACVFAFGAGGAGRDRTAVLRPTAFVLVRFCPTRTTGSGVEGIAS